MLWLLATFGSLIELAEIPTIIILIVWSVRLKRIVQNQQDQIKGVRDETQRLLWQNGLGAPESVVKPGISGKWA